MSLPENQNTALLSLLDQTSFVAATIAQINKDLQGLTQQVILFEDQGKRTIIDQLTVIVQPVLQDLSKSQPELLSQFIYRVDLAERKFIDSISGDSSLSDLAFLVIEREAQKVYLRLKFA
jgi:hypothetical protein